MTLYARKIMLRNCGRFTVVQSDFGADYRTHTHVTSEALYASLTRGITWQPSPIVIQEDAYDFARDYDLAALPIWFTPGVFLSSEAENIDGPYRLSHEAFDSNYFNVMHEVYPTTSKSYGFDKSGVLKQQSRPHHTHTYGTWQSILPDHRLLTYAYTAEESLLESFEPGQTYLLGKKRTMVQIVAASGVIRGDLQQGAGLTPYLQILPTEIVNRFQSFEILAGTVRYAIVRGMSKLETRHFWFSSDFTLPTFAIPEHVRVET